MTHSTTWHENLPPAACSAPRGGVKYGTPKRACVEQVELMRKAQSELLKMQPGPARNAWLELTERLEYEVDVMTERYLEQVGEVE